MMVAPLYEEEDLQASGREQSSVASFTEVVLKFAFHRTGSE